MFPVRSLAITEYSVEDSRILVMKSTASCEVPTIELSKSLGFSWTVLPLPRSLRFIGDVSLGSTEKTFPALREWNLADARTWRGISRWSTPVGARQLLEGNFIVTESRTKSRLVNEGLASPLPLDAL